MHDLTEHLVEDFKHSELIQVAEELGLSPISRWGSRKLISVIRQRLFKNGIPELVDNPTDRQLLLEDFLYEAGYIDDDGNKLPVKEEVYAVDLDEFMQAHNIESLPDCFSTADDDDPACKRCAVFRYCAEERIANLPPCFGLLFEVDNEECLVCLEAPFCKQQKSNT